MAFNLQSTDARSIEALRQALFGELFSLEWTAKVWNAGEASGQLVGGNLSILYSICGTPSWAPQQNSLLFIEDLDEYLYHLDRMMVALFRSGTLNGLQAVIMGALTDMHDNKVAFGMEPEEIIADNVKKYLPNIPVISGMPLGHVPFNHAVYVGRQCKFKLVNEQAILEFAS
jgi:muramoyltetrapeptide carboxypeptidase